eukprot:7147936-Prorocentrum_lima.AAC.1
MSGSKSCTFPNKATKRGTQIAGGLLEAPLQNNHVGYVHGSTARTRPDWDLCICQFCSRRREIQNWSG